tara:strand:- start:1423 stop:1779 length:357 start_codon:yes stop_codon:yes gene_type:complete
MGLHWQKPGLNHVGEYQASGHAFVVPTSSGNQRIDLDFVASGVTVFNSNAGAKITFFDSNNLEKHVNLEAVGSHTINVKFIRMQLTGSSGNTGAICQLTNIPAGDFVTLPHATMGTIT